MPDIILGSETNLGGRQYNEDRCGVLSLVTKAGVRLSVAVVCDGVGGEEHGERASQLAVDTLLDHIRYSDMAETPRLLAAAVKYANYAVFGEATLLSGSERMASTMVVAAVENGEKLYIANVGDSRIYLCRDGKLIQLTRDHTFANVMVWMGKLSPEAAASNPDADRVMRVLGTKENIQVDMGGYMDTADYGEANRIGLEGIRLKPGDSVLLCSDGLIKKSRATGQRFVTDDEILRVLQTNEGDKAARATMSIALGRIPIGEQVDNITLALLQTEDSSRGVNQAKIKQQEALKHQGEQRRRAVLVAAAVAIPMGFLLIVAVVVLYFGYSFFQESIDSTATKLAEATSLALAQTKTVVAFTSTPTPTNTPAPTSVPTAVSGEIAKIFQGDTQVDTVTEDQRKLIAAPQGETGYVAVTYLRYNSPFSAVTVDGNIYLGENTQLQFDVVTANQIQLTLLSGSDIVIQTGPYPRGAEIRLANSPASVVVHGCLAINFVDDKNFTTNCFDGECSVSTQIGGDLIQFGKGTQLKIEIGQPAPEEIPIPSKEFVKYWKLLAQTEVGKEDMKACGIPDVSATQSALATSQSGAILTAQASISPTVQIRDTATPVGAETATLTFTETPTRPATESPTLQITDTPAPTASETSATQATVDATATCAALQAASTPCP
jgi:protein phosphatase